MFRKIFFILGLLSIYTACHKDFDSGEKVTTTTFMPEIITQVNGSVLGYVYDDNNMPVEGALVEIYGASTKTDKYGVFYFENKAMDKHGTYIRITKDGFMTGSDRVYPSGGLLYSRTKLFALKKNATFTTSTGGEVAIDGGGTLNFPADAIQYENGDSYAGKVYVSSVFLSPLSPDLGEEMPGDLLGGSASGISASLGTAGMFGVVLNDGDGKKLNIKAGKKVGFSIPALSKAKPATIALWHFDENKGYWIEEGKATLSNGNYTGEVSHFSFWNCDAPFPLIELCGSVVGPTGNPLANIYVEITTEDLDVRFGYLDSEGKFCGKVPKGKKLTIVYKHIQCDKALKTLEVGPFENNVVLDPVVIEQSVIEFKGKVLCESTPVGKAIVTLQNGNKIFPVVTDEDGNWKFTTIACEPGEEWTVFGYDPATFKASVPETIVSAPVVEKDIQICNAACDLEGEIINHCSYLEIAITQGSGQYTYLWNTGDSLDVVDNLSFESELYCVTVTDENIPSCSQVFCYQFEGKMQIIIESECFNPFQVYPFGGVKPYTYQWSNGATTEIVVLNQGDNYCVTVTDKIGCTAVKCGTFDGMYLDPFSTNCNKDKFDILSSPFITGWIQVNNTTIPVTSLTGLSVFQTGFNFFATIESGQCSERNTYTLPQFKGLTINSVTNTSCAGCTDGFINIGINAGADCLQCLVGSTRIFSINDLNVDLSSLNSMNMMPKGTYYVVVEDATTGCYIAFKEVVIN
jgi:hypothetical protein